MYLFVPYDPELPDMIVGCSERDVTRNQIACVSAYENKDKGVKPRGNLVKLYGRVGDKAAETAALLDYYCPVFGLPKDIGVPEPDLTGRPVLSADTGWITFHVDPPGCRDVDDVIAWSPTERRWAITIADVDAFVGSNEALLQRCRTIGQTFYDLEGRAVRPMLPAAISEEAASLLPGPRIRPGVTLFCDEDWRPVEKGWALTAIRVDRTHTYDSATALISELPIPATTDFHDWIAQRMICYNTAAASLLKEAGVGVLRCQSVADADAVAAWRLIHQDLVHMANEAATYVPSVSAYGHAGLGVDSYCHASSPLRRYADLYNQRFLKMIIMGSRIADCMDSVADNLNQRCKAGRCWTRDLTFLELVPVGKTLTLEIVWLSDTSRVWVPAWRRLLRVRNNTDGAAGCKGTIKIFCDPTKRNWKQRIMTVCI
uniref:RNB domain-containing protein n=1 Tax=viral metagenome TaxID=1070528 RepID=A0A6C0DAM0_9ZZZZ